MKNFHCTLNGTELSWVLENMNSQETVAGWCLGSQANVYDGQGTGATNNSGLKLQQYLNSIVVVAGGKDSLLSTPTNEGGGATQSCLQQKTSAPVVILIRFLLVTLGLGSGRRPYSLCLSGIGWTNK